MLFRICLLLPVLLTADACAAERPNILWITAEDMSPTLGCYDDEFAVTPHIDALAKQSVRYMHAFATAPVCSPSRSCLITGCYATSLGTHQMRSAFPIPEFIRGFPAYLRDAGYYTTNNVKTDYNTGDWERLVKESWVESSPKAHWRNRRDASQPFFSIFNLMTSHQSRTMVWPREQFVREVQRRLSPDEIHDPAKAPLPPYYPDTPVIRRTVARYYDCVTAMDKEVGEILGQLDQDGLADDTIVFFYSDHGSGMPRHKRNLHDSGMHIPLLIRLPEKWKHLAPKPPGDTTGRLVSFVNFAPSVLSLADVEIPEYMQGKPFLGKAESKPRKYVFGHRDRIDEVIDMARSVRSKRYLYIRNYMPHLGWNQRSAWPDAGEIRHEIYRLADREKMTDAQWQFAGPTRPAVELYDCEADPHNIRNLADSPEHKEFLTELAFADRKHQQKTRDVGFVPEIEMWNIARKQTLWEAARDGGIDIEELHLAAAAAGSDDVARQQRYLASPDPNIRYWGALGLAQREKLSDESCRLLAGTLSDGSPTVRIAAASSLSGDEDAAVVAAVLTSLLKSDDLTTVLYAARQIELMGDSAAHVVSDMRDALARSEEILPPDAVPTTAEQDLAMFIGFSIRAFLSRVDAEAK